MLKRFQTPVESAIQMLFIIIIIMIIIYYHRGTLSYQIEYSYRDYSYCVTIIPRRYLKNATNLKWNVHRLIWLYTTKRIVSPERRYLPVNIKRLSSIISKTIARLQQPKVIDAFKQFYKDTEGKRAEGALCLLVKTRVWQTKCIFSNGLNKQIEVPAHEYRSL